MEMTWKFIENKFSKGLGNSFLPFNSLVKPCGIMDFIHMQ